MWTGNVWLVPAVPAVDSALTLWPSPTLWCGGVDVELRSGLLLTGAVLVTVLTVTVTVVVWERWRSASPVRWVARLALVLGCQLCLVLVVALAANNSFVFFTSWADVLGRQQHRLAPGTVHPGAIDSRYREVVTKDWLGSRGTVVPISIPGSVSGVRARPAYAYLPPQYGSPAYAHRSFPVVELLDGYPGSPLTWLHAMDLRATLDGEIAAGRTIPMIAVLPTQTVSPPRDTECVNVPKGPQVETYLTTDVRRAVLRQLRASADRASWAVMGYSTGGYCAINLLLHHPSAYQTAVSMSGYYTALSDRTTGDLFGRSHRLKLYYSPLWFERHSRMLPSQLLLTATREDAPSFRTLAQFVAHLGSAVQATTLVLPHGGHNFGVWRVEEPASFDWLGHHLSAPLSAGLTVPDLPPALQARRSPAAPPSASVKP